MKEFNLFNPILEDRKLYDDLFYILGLKGDDEYRDEHTYIGGKPIYFNEDFKRKSESDKMINCMLLIYTPENDSLVWKCLYKNSKGIYMNKNRKKYYLKDFKELQ